MKCEPYIGMPINLAECGCSENPQEADRAAEGHKNLSLAMAYVLWQRWDDTYSYEKALQRGTIFPSLDLPFTAYRGGAEK